MTDRKPLFDAIRKLLGRPLKQADVDMVNAALESRMLPDTPSQPETSHIPFRTSPVGKNLIKEFEGCHRKMADGRFMAYPDPGSGGAPWTIGWGTTMHDGRPIKPGTIWTQAQCDDALAKDLVSYEAEVRAALGSALAKTSQLQFDALVSFHYNTGAIGRATLTAKHKAGNYMGAMGEFIRWNRAGGRVLAGLTRRRTAEARLYKEGME